MADSYSAEGASTARFDISDTDPDPFAQFERWFEEAEQAGVREPDAMTLATVDAHGVPSARTVALRGFDRRGFAFYTNVTSRKGGELAENNRVAIVFHWREQLRQVRAVGIATARPKADADAYFATRNRESQIGAWASAQSSVLADRAALDARVAEAAERFAGGPVPRPPYWRGFSVEPHEWEFWLGHEDRLHDRVHYRPDPDTPGAWIRERLSP